MSDRTDSMPDAEDLAQADAYTRAVRKHLVMLLYQGDFARVNDAEFATVLAEYLRGVERMWRATFAALSSRSPLSVPAVSVSCDGIVPPSVGTGPTTGEKGATPWTVWTRGPSGRWRASGFLAREARDAFAGWACLFFGERNVATEDVYVREGIEVDAAQPPLGVPLGAEGAGPAGALCAP